MLAGRILQAEGSTMNSSACLVVEELEDIRNVIRDALVACKQRACCRQPPITGPC